MSIKGMPDLLKAFHAMKEVPDVKPILMKAADPILQSAKANSKNHYVKSALGYITKNDSKFPNVVLIGVRSEYEGSPTMTVAALAVIEEFGTAVRSTSQVANRGYIKPRPYMRPAVDSNKERTFNTILNGLTEIIDKQANNLNLK